jgi:hypothetical protein
MTKVSKLVYALKGPSKFIGFNKRPRLNLWLCMELALIGDLLRCVILTFKGS